MSSLNITASAFSASAFGALCSAFDAFISNSSYNEYISDDGLIFIDDVDFLHQPLHYPTAKTITKVVGCEIRFNDNDIIPIEEHINRIENKTCLYCGRDEKELIEEGEHNAILGCACHQKNLICLNCCLGYAKSCGGSSVKCAFREHNINFNRTNITEQSIRLIEPTNYDYRNYIKEKLFNEGFKYNYEFWRSNIKGKTDYYDDYSEIYNYFTDLLSDAINENYGIRFNDEDPNFYKSFYFYDEDDNNIIKWEMGGYNFKDPNFIWNGFELKAVVRVNNQYEKIRINLEELSDVVDRLQDHFSDGYINGYSYTALFNMLKPNFKRCFGDDNNNLFRELVNGAEDEETQHALFIEMCDPDLIRDEITAYVDNNNYDGEELGFYYFDTEFKNESLIVWFDTYESVFNHH